MPVSRTIVDTLLRAKHGEAAYRIVEKLTDAGHDTWWVGGCVRDLLQEKIPTDIDIATAATPDQILKVFPNAKQEDAFLGAVRLQDFEVTTFREDDEASDGRRPETVVFGTREKDAARRDFTVNALYYQPITRELYDPFEGEPDLKERLVRFIGSPAVRIKHDALRILRAVRLRATLEGQYDPETYLALRELAQLTETLSGTRKLEEIEKILARHNPQRAFEDLWELGILNYILPELYVCKGVAQPADYHHEGDVWDHTMKLIGSFREEDTADTRLAGLLHDCGKAQTFSRKERIRFDKHASTSAENAQIAFRRLQMAKKRSEKICWIIEHHMMMGTFFTMPDERKAHWYFHPWFPELLQVFWLDIAGTEPADFSMYDDIVKDRQKFLDSHPRPEKPLLTGEEVMEILGVKPGAEVGRILNELHDAQVQKKVEKKADALAFLQEMSQKGDK